MTLGVILRPRAERDIEIARNWYDAQQVGLGEAFLSAVQERLEAIRRFPEACPEIHKTVRRALIQRFTYLIFISADSQQDRRVGGAAYFSKPRQLATTLKARTLATGYSATRPWRAPEPRR